ncbi:hypothetical protein Salat_1429300 [Sesamum alatum]|uniref:Reverse transcriptase zinc-binding domain-containing protein n=1 Tax=Sesamum alatum TaxID=300844 RepID=A0AAE2CLI3_9LAMI|nr:hypothetical protein Salat_1429300 [Sesamum alatum]
MVWRPNLNGAFFVRSAYEVGLRVATRPIPTSSRSFTVLAEGCEQFWRWLWTAFVPPRVRVQVWRLCYEAVPIMINLSRKHAGFETKCVLCEAEVETTKHVLLECPFARMYSNVSDEKVQLVFSCYVGHYGGIGIEGGW